MDELVPAELIDTHPAAAHFVSYMKVWNIGVRTYRFLLESDVEKIPLLLAEVEKVTRLTQEKLPTISLANNLPYQAYKDLEPSAIANKLDDIFQTPWVCKEKTIWSTFSNKVAMLQVADYLVSFKIPCVCGSKRDQEVYFIQLKPEAINYELYDKLPNFVTFVEQRKKLIENSPIGKMTDVIQSYLN